MARGRLKRLSVRLVLELLQSPTARCRVGKRRDRALSLTVRGRGRPDLVNHEILLHHTILYDAAGYVHRCPARGSELVGVGERPRDRTKHVRGLVLFGIRACNVISVFLILVAVVVCRLTEDSFGRTARVVGHDLVVEVGLG